MSALPPIATSKADMSQLWQKGEGRSDFVVAAKGAPEIIADLCHLGPAELQAVRRSVDSMATEGLRVLGVAKAMHEGAQWPESQRDFPFVFLGLVGLADPLRSSVPAAVRECGSAGIRVVMITGDYPATARAIAQRAGLDASAALTGDEIEHLDDSELARSARTVGIFARIMCNATAYVRFSPNSDSKSGHQKKKGWLYRP